MLSSHALQVFAWQPWPHWSPAVDTSCGGAAATAAATTALANALIAPPAMPAAPSTAPAGSSCGRKEWRPGCGGVAGGRVACCQLASRATPRCPCRGGSEAVAGGGYDKAAGGAPAKVNTAAPESSHAVRELPCGQRAVGTQTLAQSKNARGTYPAMRPCP
eukprot:366137-Chlamydomonas_euryale.AAC.6